MSLTDPATQLEIVRIGVGAIAESPAPRLAAMGLLHLDYVSPKPGQRLGAGRSRLELGEVEHLDLLERRLDPGRDLWLHYPFPHGDPSLQQCALSGTNFTTLDLFQPMNR